MRNVDSCAPLLEVEYVGPGTTSSSSSSAFLLTFASSRGVKCRARPDGGIAWLADPAVSSANMTALKIKAGSLFLALGLGLSTAAIITSITGCASGPFSSNLNQSPPDSKSAWGGDDHAQPVYTSPTVTPATNNLANSPSD